ncbi:tandem-95 repeat protein [Myxococcus sp. XM-1-1-1]|uniref:Ig-like domain-containing protein n=1 Tax=Myxococcus sp. XM-1-1-1 TaxID=2874602 RepID=UPI001CBB5AFE|nr:tandem-95 repeat protein [Myxococcus sp. XM-1-1-1]
MSVAAVSRGPDTAPHDAWSAGQLGHFLAPSHGLDPVPAQGTPPFLSSERDVGARQLGPARRTQSTPRAASDGTNFLVVWIDDRDERNASQLRATRVSPSGELLDPLGIALPGSETRHPPAVVFDGTNYRVVWVGQAPTGGTFLNSVRIRPDGTLVEATPQVIVPAPSASHREFVEVTLVSNGVDLLLVWGEREVASSETPQLRTTRVSLDGLPATPVGHELYHGGDARVAWSGSEYLVVSNGVFLSNNALWGARLDASGALIERIFLERPQGRILGHPAIDSDGEGYFVTWSEAHDVNRTAVAVMGARVSAAGVMATAVTLFSGAGDRRPVGVAFDGTNHVVAWTDYAGGEPYDSGGLRATRISRAGAVLTPASIVLRRNTVDGARQATGLALSHGSVLVAWHDASPASDEQDTWASVMSLSGTVLKSEQRLSSSTNTQTFPAIATDGHGYLVVWTNRTQTPRFEDIHGTFLSAAGTELTPGGFVISDAVGVQRSPTVAFDGTQYLVVWQDERATPQKPKLYGRRIPPPGHGARGAEFPIPTEYEYNMDQQVACGGGACLVTWGSGYQILATRVSAAGAVLDPQPIVLTPDVWNVMAEPSVSFDGADFMVIWNRYLLGDGVHQLEGVRVDKDGLLLEPGRFVLGEPNKDLVSRPGLAFDGQNHLMVWGEQTTVRSQRVSRSGTLLDLEPRVLASGLEAPSTPNLAFDGEGFLVSIVSRLSGEPWHHPWRVWARRVLPSGEASGDLMEVAPDQDPHAPQGSSIASVGPGHFMLVSSRLTGEPHAAPRVHTREVAYNAGPEAESGHAVLDEDTPRPITLTGTDPEGDALGFFITVPPAHGTLTGTPPQVVYTPDENFHGTDQFRFLTRDRGAPSDEATVSLTVTSKEDVPAAKALTLSLQEDTAAQLVLDGSDGDGDPLMFTVTVQPAHGTLTGTPPRLTYTPHADFHGVDAFEFVANDGRQASTPVAASLTVTPVNDAPIARAGRFTVSAAGSVEVMLEGSDIDGDTLAYRVTRQPMRGALSGTPPRLVYRADETEPGEDSFEYSVSDGSLGATAMVTMDVTQRRNQAPVIREQTFVVPQGASIDIVLDAEDPDGDALTYAITQAPASGTLTGEAPTLTYRASSSFAGEASFTYTASDGLETVMGRVRIEVQAPPAPPRTPSSGGCSASPGTSSVPVLFACFALTLLARRNKDTSIGRVLKRPG